MASQISIEVTEVLSKELDMMVEEGYFRNTTEAVKEALNRLVLNYRAELSKKKMDRISEKTKGAGINLTQSIIHIHEEEE